MVLRSFLWEAGRPLYQGFVRGYMPLQHHQDAHAVKCPNTLEYDLWGKTCNVTHQYQ